MIHIALIAAFLASSAPLRADDAVSGSVWIRAENDGSGAGFLVDTKKRWIVTCRHVVADRDTVDVYFAWRKNGKLVTEKSEYLGNRATLREHGLLLRGKVVKKSDEADLALVELDSLPTGVTALPLAMDATRPGDPIRAVGHRIDLDTVFNFTSGSVRQTGRLLNGYPWRGRKLAVTADTILGQLPIEEGDSGGPVLNNSCEVVGMASALRRQTPEAAIVISVAEICRFLQVEHPKAKPAPPNIGDVLMRCTAWVRPTATETQQAGTLIANNLILTSARGLGPWDRVGIAFPQFESGKWISAREVYRDSVGLKLKGVWRAGLVIARDPVRDLALIRVESAPEHMRPIPMSGEPPTPGEAIHAMSHPGGLEFAWVYASGAVRQRGRLVLGERDTAQRVGAILLQLPAQAGSAGGPILNGRGDLIGVLAGRESAQQTGYCIDERELAHFLHLARTDRPAKSLAGLLSRAEAGLNFTATALAEALIASIPFGAFEKGASADVERTLRLAILLDPDCHRARQALMLLLLKAKRTEEYAAELDRMVERPKCFASHVFIRAVDRMEKQEWRLARADLERILEVLPDDALARRKLIRVLLELNKDDEAAAAVKDAIRSQDAGLHFLAADLLDQADRLARKYPDSPSIQLNWIRLAIGAAAKYDSNAQRRADCEVVLKAAADAPDDAARLRLLRNFLEKLKADR